MSILATLAGVGMAVGPPLVYADQAYSIVKRKDSSGFSHDVCGVLLIANIIRIFFWLGNRFETVRLAAERHGTPTEYPTALLVQSILLIISQLFLLALCLHYRPSYDSLASDPSRPDDGPREEDAAELEAHDSNWTPRRAAPQLEGGRLYHFWQWDGFGEYVEFLAGLILVLGVLQLICGRWAWYINTLGFVALTIESTLPIPQFISNYRRKTTHGFRASTLAGWFFGDSFKTGYFFLRHSPIQFKVTAIMTVCWDTAVFVQRIRYGTAPPGNPSGNTDEEGRLNRRGSPSHGIS